MRRVAAIATMLVACGEPAADPPVDAAPEGLPEGVWEPIAGAYIRDAKLAADGDTIWWVVARELSAGGEHLSNKQVWMTATSTTGVTLVAPSQVAPAYPYDLEPDVVVTPSAIVTKIGTVEPVFQRYDRAGQPLGAPYVIEIEDGSRAISDFGRTELIATVDGGAQYLSALGDDIHEVAIVDLDADGMPQPARFTGTPEPDAGGTNAWGIAAAIRPDGSTIVAWDRGYHGCLDRPGATLVAVLDDAGFGPSQSVADPRLSVFDPAVATRGDAAYVAWRMSSWAPRIQLARFPDVTTVIAELEDPGRYISAMSIALAAPTRGVIAWESTPSTVGAGTETVISVMPFEDRDGVVLFGATHVVARVDDDAQIGGAQLVHVADDRYAIGWIESRWYGADDDTRSLYATELDFATTSMRPAPRLEPPATPTQRDRRRCP